MNDISKWLSTETALPDGRHKIVIQEPECLETQDVPETRRKNLVSLDIWRDIVRLFTKKDTCRLNTRDCLDFIETKINEERENRVE